MGQELHWGLDQTQNQDQNFKKESQLQAITVFQQA